MSKKFTGRKALGPEGQFHEYKESGLTGSFGDFPNMTREEKIFWQRVHGREKGRKYKIPSQKKSRRYKGKKYFVSGYWRRYKKKTRPIKSSDWE